MTKFKANPTLQNLFMVPDCQTSKSTPSVHCPCEEHIAKDAGLASSHARLELDRYIGNTHHRGRL